MAKREKIREEFEREENERQKSEKSSSEPMASKSGYQCNVQYSSLTFFFNLEQLVVKNDPINLLHV